jgi:hypothetical protein
MSTPVIRLLVTIATAVAVSHNPCAQPELAAADPRPELIAKIAALRVAAGPTPVNLIDPLRDLALLYESAGDHALAIVAIEEARHVTRVHQGLSSADEALLLREQIRNEKALANHQRVWDLEEKMVTIARRHYDDVRMVPIFRELAEDRAAALEEYRAGGYPPEIELGCYYGTHPSTHGVNCRGGARRTVIMRFYFTILAYYANAIEVLVRNGDYASHELRDLEKQALRFGFTRTPLVNPFCPRALEELLALPLVGSCLEPVNSGVGNWVGLVRLIAYEIRAGAPAAVRAKAFADLADWHLVVTPANRRRFSEMSDAAFKIYEVAYRLLQQEDDATAIAEIFSPQLPVTLPTYRPNPFASTGAVEPSRYIDVAFEITKYGRGEHIEILDTSTNATRAERRDLIRLIETMTFRPKLVDGRVADSAAVVVRYPLAPRDLPAS